MGGFLFSHSYSDSFGCLGGCGCGCESDRDLPNEKWKEG